MIWQSGDASRAANVVMIISRPGPRRSGAVALLEFFLASARAGVIAANLFERITYWLLRTVIAVRAVHMVIMIVVMIAVGAMYVGLLGHRSHSGM